MPPWTELACLRALLVLVAVNMVQMTWIMIELREGLRRQWLELRALRDRLDARAREPGDERE